jgi:hypothetical protein
MKDVVDMVITQDGDQRLGRFGESMIWYPVMECTHCDSQGIIVFSHERGAYDCEECHGSGWVRDFSDCKDDEMPYSRYEHVKDPLDPWRYVTRKEEL